MSTTGTQAPMVNFDTTTTRRTASVAVAPTALMAMWRFQPDSFSRRWCTTMPTWDRVKPRNTPTAYRGIRAVVTPPKMTMRSPDTTARPMMPLE